MQEVKPSNDSEMRAAEYDRYGPSSVMQVRNVSRPRQGTGDVLVRVHAASINPIDTLIRSGKLAFKTGKKFPKRTGIDFAGEIVQASTADSGLKVGNRVWGVMLSTESGTGQGCAAEFLSVPCGLLALSPRTLSFVEAAALSSVGAVAIIALEEKAKLQPGERILIRGAAGGVGCVAVQLAKLMGAHITTLASAKDADFLKSLGAHDVFDYRTKPPSELGDFDVIVDLVGTELSRYRRLLSPKGRMFCLSITGIGAILYMFFSRVYGSKRVAFFSASPTKTTMDKLTSYVEKGSLKSVAPRVYDLQDIGEAHRASEARETRGKCVLKLS